MKSARERMLNDPHYAMIVNQFQSLIREGQFTPSEIREAAILASIIDAETRVRTTITIPHTEELERSLQMIHKVTEEYKR